ncbi:hypothetical protein BKA66DRAFT_449452 [Pyrenochaeta sp. MPI-SDFR-AT-0127]|nr:hypothetical protein BKA66DRAFT_449452 [Pyrenochaeta sp. MPI-SDFR-AT-0127]
MPILITLVFLQLLMLKRIWISNTLILSRSSPRLQAIWQDGSQKLTHSQVDSVHVPIAISSCHQIENPLTRRLLPRNIERFAAGRVQSQMVIGHVACLEFTQLQTPAKSNSAQYCENSHLYAFAYMTILGPRFVTG